MKNIRVFVPENFQFLQVKFSIYLNRLVFVMVPLELVHCDLTLYFMEEYQAIFLEP